jgi:hypothetical protein
MRRRELAERFDPVLESPLRLSFFMMPAWIASTAPEQQIKEIIGSGPFKFARNERAGKASNHHTFERSER